jgi:hypothetical protein
MIGLKWVDLRKPTSLLALGGTAEVAPFPKQSMRWLLKTFRFRCNVSGKTGRRLEYS